MEEIIVDSFAGGGGASAGIEMALGRPPDIAINHNATALAMHAANHPRTRHMPHNIWKVDPVDACGRRPVGLLWASPDCKHFSKAKGGKPVSRGIRDLAWVVVRWAQQVKPRVIILENVEEFSTWGPVLAETGLPCPKRRGKTFEKFVSELRWLGYRVEHKMLRACDYGVPTTRRRLFLIARRDGLPIIWPAPTHGAPASKDVVSGTLKPWRVAAEIIDWSLPCPSIFATSEEIMQQYGLRAIRPLADATMARIAKGVWRYVLNSANPFIIPVTHTRDRERGQPIDEPLATVTAAHRGEQALVTPVLINTRNGERAGQEPRCRSIEEPCLTVTAQGSQGALIAAFLAQHNTDMVGHDAREPVSTIIGKGCTQAVVSVSGGVLNMKGSKRAICDITQPVPTICCGTVHAAEVRAFLVKYYGSDQDPKLDKPLHTTTTRGRFGLVTVRGVEYEIADIGMRMFTPRELFRAQGFPDTYIIDRDSAGNPISKTDQISMCGNSVCPPLACALVKANFEPVTVTPQGVPEFMLEAAE